MKGFQHWQHQRLTALCLMILGPWFVYKVKTTSLMNWHHELSNPLTMTFLSFFTFSLIYHAVLGLQMVIEDYVHTVIIRKVLIQSLHLLGLWCAFFAWHCILCAAFNGKGL